MADALWKPNLLADSIQPALGRTWGPEYLQNMQRQVWRVRGCLGKQRRGRLGTHGATERAESTLERARRQVGRAAG